MNPLDPPSPPAPPPPRGRGLPPPLPDLPMIVAVPGPLAIKDRRAHPSNYGRALRSETRFLVVHCTDGCEGTTKDDDAAAMFADGNLKPHRSAHYVVDADSVTQCVPDGLTAWHCGHTGNSLGVGIEICGRANQTRAEWLDAISLATLNITARLLAELCEKHDIPPIVLNDRGLRQGMSGITTHAFVSQAWGESTHLDPGEGFPLGALVVAVGKVLLRG